MPAKSLPIGKRDQARIIHAMAETHAWTGYRNGRKIAMVRLHLLTGQKSSGLCSSIATGLLASKILWRTRVWR